MTDTLKGQISNEEREQRQQHEEKLKGISPLKENPPYWLSTMAKNEWIRIYPHIIELPISELDRTLLAMYCNSYAQYRQALEDVAAEGQVVFEVNSKGFEVKKKNASIENHDANVERGSSHFGAAWSYWHSIYGSKTKAVLENLLK